MDCQLIKYCNLLNHIYQIYLAQNINKTKKKIKNGISQLFHDKKLIVCF